MARLEILPDERVAWRRLILHLESRGVTLRHLSRALDIPFSTLKHWRLEKSRPKYEEGLRIYNAWLMASDATDLITIKLTKHEFIDWFRVVVDLNKKGHELPEIALGIGVAKSTLIGWKLDTHRPRFEEGTRLLNYWSDLTGGRLRNAPKHDPAKPHLRFSMHHKNR